MVSAKSNSLNQYIGRKFKSFFLIFLFLTSIIFIDINTVDYGIEGCEKNTFEIMENSNKTNVTFITFGDSQHWDPTNRQNDYQVEALNNFNEILSWKDAGYDELGDISDIRGVIMAGDITQNGRDGRVFSNDEYGEFIQRYGLCGNKQLKYPIYEGYGNHDYYEWHDIFYRIPQDHPVIDSVAVRNEYRSNLTNIAPGMDGHYSWEWDNIHFIQLNLAPSDIVPAYEEGGFRNPHNALTFMKNDLDEYVVGTDKKVVLIAHYGPWEWREWDETQIENLCNVIEEYRPYIIGYIHGHSHSTKVYNWCDITIFNSGSPYHEGGIHSSYNEDLRGRFTLFRILQNETEDLKLIAVDVSWSADNYSEGDIESLDLQMKEWEGFPYEENIPN